MSQKRHWSVHAPGAWSKRDTKGAVLRKTDQLISSLLGEDRERQEQAEGAAEEDDNVAAAADADAPDSVTGAMLDVRATSALDSAIVLLVVVTKTAAMHCPPIRFFHPSTTKKLLLFAFRKRWCLRACEMKRSNILMRP